MTKHYYHRVTFLKLYDYNALPMMTAYSIRMQITGAGAGLTMVSTTSGRRVLRTQNRFKHNFHVCDNKNILH